MSIVCNTIWFRDNIKNSLLFSYQTAGTFHKYKPQELWHTPYSPLTLQLICLVCTVAVPTSVITVSFRRTDRSVKLFGQIMICYC